MVYTLIVNSSNVVEGSNNSRYRYKFSTGSVNITNGSLLAVQNFSIPYCTFNITSYYNNNSFGYIFNGTTYTINIPDGFYSMSNLNDLLRNAFYTNGHYRIDSNADIWYPASIFTNSIYYSNQFNADIITAVLPNGFTNPANFNTSTDTIIRLVIPNNNIRSIFGFSAGTYPQNNQSTRYSKISDITPNASPVNSIIMRCTLCDNRFSNPSDIISCFSPNVDFGNNIIVQNQYINWINCKVGSVSEFEIQFLDQNYRNIDMKDNNITVQLLLDIKK